MKNTISIGKVEIELPEYMVSLNQEEINKLDVAGEPKIIACGVHADGKVTLITTHATVVTFDPQKYHVPAGSYLPLPGGEDVFLPNTNERWPGIDRGFNVKTKWLLENSEQEMNNATLKMNNRYVGEIDIAAAEVPHT